MNLSGDRWSDDRGRNSLTDSDMSALELRLLICSRRDPLPRRTAGSPFIRLRDSRVRRRTCHDWVLRVGLDLGFRRRRQSPNMTEEDRPACLFHVNRPLRCQRPERRQLPPNAPSFPRSCVGTHVFDAPASFASPKPSRPLRNQHRPKAPPSTPTTTRRRLLTLYGHIRFGIIIRWRLAAPLPPIHQLENQHTRPRKRAETEPAQYRGKRHAVLEIPEAKCDHGTHQAEGRNRRYQLDHPALGRRPTAIALEHSYERSIPVQV
jgi:hypothetical protein